MTPEDEKRVQEMIENALHRRDGQILHPSRFVPGLIKRRYLEDKVIVFGLAADRPTDNSTGISAYFSTDTNVLSLYDGAEWVRYARIPATLADYTATNVTPDRAFDADSTTTAELGDVLGTLIADLQSIGLIS